MSQQRQAKCIIRVGDYQKCIQQRTSILPWDLRNNEHLKGDWKYSVMIHVLNIEMILEHNNNQIESP